MRQLPEQLLQARVSLRVRLDQVVVGIVAARLLALTLSEAMPAFLGPGREEDGGVKPREVACRPSKLLGDRRRILPGYLISAPCRFGLGDTK
jgi:hypothetical protein